MPRAHIGGKARSQGSRTDERGLIDVVVKHLELHTEPFFRRVIAKRVRGLYKLRVRLLLRRLVPVTGEEGHGRRTKICRLVDRALERILGFLPLTFVQRVRVQLVFELHRVRAEGDRQVTLVQNRLGLLLFRAIGLDLDRVKEVVARNRRQCI